MDEFKQAILNAFATHYHYYLKAQNFHWNVTGLDFLEYHKLFGDIYEELEDAIDPFAENLRAMRVIVPATFLELTALSQLSDQIKPLTKDDMLRCLYKDNGKIVKALTTAYAECEQEGEHGFSGFLADRLAAQRKHGWQLYSSIPI